MPYKLPKTWDFQQDVTSAEFNAEIRDQLAALKNPPSDIVDYATAANIDFSNTTFSNLAPFVATITTPVAGDVMVGASFTLRPSADATVRIVSFDLTRNGNTISAGEGVFFVEGNTNNVVPVSHFWILKNLPPGTHILRLQGKVSAGTARIFGNTGGARTGLAQFWAREMS